MDEKIIGILAAASGVATTEVAELIKTDEGAAELQGKVEAKLTAVKNQADQRATKKTRTAVENALKAAGVEGNVFEEGRGFEENVAAAVEALQSKSAATSGADLTEEQILKLQPVIALKNRLTLETDQKVQSARQEEKDALKKERDAFRTEQTMVGVRAWAEKLVGDLNPNFSTDAEVAAFQRQDLIDKIIGAGTYQKEGTSYVLLDADGEIRKDAAQNPLKPEEEARTIAKRFYGLPVADKREIPPAGRTTGATGVIKTKDEFDAAVVKAQSDPKALDKLLTDYPDFAKQ